MGILTARPNGSCAVSSLQASCVLWTLRSSYSASWHYYCRDGDHESESHLDPGSATFGELTQTDLREPVAGKACLSALSSRATATFPVPVENMERWHGVGFSFVQFQPSAVGLGTASPLAICQGKAIAREDGLLPAPLLCTGPSAIPHLPHLQGFRPDSPSTGTTKARREQKHLVLGKSVAPAPDDITALCCLPIFQLALSLSASQS